MGKFIVRVKVETIEYYDVEVEAKDRKDARMNLDLLDVRKVKKFGVLDQPETEHHILVLWSDPK